MSLGALVLLAIGLAMDATAVAAARGLAVERVLPRHAFRVAVLFGGFQALMPAVGWWAGVQLGGWIEAWDHWIAFGLLGAIGGKMLWEARSAPAGPEVDRGDPLAWRVMVTLAVATSIDALAVGVTLPLLDVPLGLAVATIGVTTAVLSVAGLYAGRWFGAVLGRRLEAVGGVVLIGLGTKILLQHLLQPV